MRCEVDLPFCHVHTGHYGHSLNVWSWPTHEQIQRIDLGPEGLIPLEIRFLHDPTATEGYVGCALSSTVFRFFKTQVNSYKTFLINFKKRNFDDMSSGEEADLKE